jgi:hypothetical protein
MNDRPKSLRPAAGTDLPGGWGVLLVAFLLGLSELVAAEIGNDAARPSRAINPPAVVTPAKGAEAKLAQAAITKEITAQVRQLGLEAAYQNWIVTNLCATFPRLPDLKGTLQRATHDVANVQAVALALSHDINTAIAVDKGSNPYELGEVLDRKKANCIGSAQVFYITASAVGLTVVPIEIRNDPRGKLAFHVANLVRLPDGRYLRIDFLAEQPKPIGSIRAARVFSLEKEFTPQGAYQVRVNDHDADLYQRIRLMKGLPGLLSFAAVNKRDYRRAIALDPENAAASECLGAYGQLTSQELAARVYVASAQAYLEEAQALLAAITLDPQTTYCSEKLRILFWEAAGPFDRDFIRESAGIVVAAQQEALTALKRSSWAEETEELEHELKEWLMIKQDAQKPSS